MKKFIHVILSLLLVVSLFALVSCGRSSLKGALNGNTIWETATDENGSSMRWEFTEDTVKYINIIDGEETFTQTFNFSVDGNKLIFQSDYATLTFETDVNGDTMTVKTEAGKTLIFEKK